MKRIRVMTVISILLALCIMGANTVSIAQDQDRDRDQTRLREQIHKDTDISDTELESLNLQLREHLRLKGTGDQLRAMIREAVGQECRGNCLRDCIRAMNRLMEQGYSENEAGEMIRSELRIQARERSRLKLNNDELGERIMNRVEEQLQYRKKVMEQKKIKMREHEMSPMREMGGAGGGRGGRK